MREATNLSRSIARILHDGATLRIFYTSGATWDYDDVSDHLVDGLLKSEEPARFIIDRIKDGRQPVPVEDNTPFPRQAWD
jgi:hypothetical protein